VAASATFLTLSMRSTTKVAQSPRGSVAVVPVVLPGGGGGVVQGAW
jgi:hypothetical protein